MSEVSRHMSLVVQEQISEVIATGEREVVTPEGVALRFRIAPVSARAIAFIIDIFMVVMFSLAFGIVGLTLSFIFDGSDTGAVFSAVTLVSMFLLRTFYFILLEILWRGQTFGKKAMRLRVVDAHGGDLTVGALIVRNLTREVELFLPLVALIVPSTFIPGASTLVAIFALCWTLLFVLMPWLNRDRMRVGDLAASTMVISEPKAQLLEEASALARGQTQQAKYSFTTEQLDMYGIYELQVLEDFLRQYPSENAMQSVSDKIIAKIAWRGDGSAINARVFLENFYDALRMRREQQLLFGKRQESKKEGSLSDSQG